MPLTILGSKAQSQNLQDFAVYGFRGLLNIKKGPQELDDTELTAATNIYGRADGDIELRKGMTARGSLLSNSPGSGLFELSQQVINATSVTAVNTLLAQVGGNLYDDGTGLQIGPNNVLGASALPWSAVQMFDSQHLFSPPKAPTLTTTGSTGLAAGTYGYRVTAKNASGETTAGYEATITIASTKNIIITWPAVTGATGYNVYGRTAGSELKIATLGNVLTFTDNGSVTPSGALPASNTAGVSASDVLVICTGVNGPYIFDGTTVYTPSGWSSVSGARWCALVNNILWFGGIPSQPNLVYGTLLGSPETLQNSFAVSSAVTGLGVVGAGAQAQLVVGTRLGITTITGTSYSNFYQQDIPSTDGVAAGRTMISVDGYLFFLGNNGMYQFDGQNIQIISDNVEPWILNDPLYTDYPMNGLRSLSWAFYYNRRIYFFYDSGNLGYPTTGLVYDLTLSGWTVYTGPKLNAGVLLNAPGDASPPAAVVIDATKGQVYNFDVYNGTGHNVDDAGTVFASLATTKYFKIGLPGTEKRLMRLYVEVFLDTAFGGSLFSITDYGASAASTIVGIPLVVGAQWDMSNWDQSYFAAAQPQFVKQRVDVNIPYEAVAFSIQTADSNPPYRFQGLSGTFSQQGRN